MPDPIGHQVREDRAASPSPYTRLLVVLRHSTRYAFASQSRLAQDVGCARSTISRIVAGKSRPNPRLARAVADALSADLGVPLPLNELFSLEGSYPTRSGCALCGCDGCFPDEAYDRWGNLKPAFYHQHPGDWSLAEQVPIASMPTTADPA